MKTCIAISSIINPDAPIALSGDIEERINDAKEIGYEAVEIHTPSASLINTAKISRICEKLDVKVATLGTGAIWGKFGFSLTDPDFVRRSVLNRMLFEFIDAASELDSKITIGNVKGNMNGDRRHGYKILVDELREVSDYAGGKGVIILLEATNRYENNYFNRGEEIQDFIERNNLENIEILMDAFHINIEERTSRGVIKNVRDHLGHVHFADNNRLYPGGGRFDFTSMISELKEIDYDKYLSVECLPCPDGMTAARRAHDFFVEHF